MKKIFPLIVVLIIHSFLVSACAMSPVTVRDSSPEPLYGMTLGNGLISAQVLSNGCTTADSFKLESQAGKQLTLMRSTPDRCRRAKHKVWVDIPLPEETKKVFFLSNPFSTNW
ncbi:MAG: hypothetical protein HON77_10905 [Gammaproteobacteria bacterium]|jgi:hypothetical protein|nr:hypothetical protein [Gammaproteobacteria bacterium]MBT5152891.1 hypothetical protein [Gammaproteobacteria bacterium]MBT6584804.1 hypothetical protein [Gammaproteobacteria bacterium]MBT7879239.1 hypothetical protein [Gammaproteobacteria bacterium]